MTDGVNLEILCHSIPRTCSQRFAFSEGQRVKIPQIPSCIKAFPRNDAVTITCGVQPIAQPLICIKIATYMNYNKRVTNSTS